MRGHCLGHWLIFYCRWQTERDHARAQLRRAVDALLKHFYKDASGSTKIRIKANLATIDATLAQDGYGTGLRAKRKQVAAHCGPLRRAVADFLS